MPNAAKASASKAQPATASAAMAALTAMLAVRVPWSMTAILPKNGSSAQSPIFPGGAEFYETGSDFRERIPMAETARPNDLDSYWMPFTANRQFKAKPRLMASAEGMYY